MTTNHKEKLDPALLRPGRADRCIELGNAKESQLTGLFKKFFPESPPEQQQEFANQLPENKIGMAKLQGHFLKYRGEPELAIKNAKSLLELEFQVKDMHVSQWLRRLNFQKYTIKFN